LINNRMTKSNNPSALFIIILAHDAVMRGSGLRGRCRELWRTHQEMQEYNPRTPAGFPDPLQT
jgi:hypothetical protein